MRILDYLKSKAIYLIVNIASLVLIIWNLTKLNVGVGMIIIVLTFWLFPLVTHLIVDCYKQKIFYDNIQKALETLDKKYLLPEVIKKPDFLQGEIQYDMLRVCAKEMHEHVNQYKYQQEAYKEYIETWIHEVKMPIASTRLIIENNNNIVTKSIEQELRKIENYTEQVLFYCRSNNVEKDYIIKELELKKAVTNVVKRNSKDCIQKSIKVNIENTEGTVYSDIKWIEFIINQIVNNSIKYTKENGTITIKTTSNKNNIILNIKDNGIGISEKDIKKVFEKGFTGENGREYAKSTGIGLYLSKKLCHKLGLDINIISNKHKGTEVNIIFPIYTEKLLEKNR